MRILTLMGVFLVALGALSGQIVETGKFISVTGSAEIIVQPDQLELEITLKEYNQGKRKIDLSKIESKFFDVLKSNQVEEKNVQFTSSHYYWYYWWNYRKEHLKQKRYKLQLNSTTDFLALVQALDMPGVLSLRIANTSNKKLQQFRKDIKISALKAAKDKANYLLESIDEKLGSIISVEEIDQQNNHYYWRQNQQILSNVSINSGSSYDNIEHVAAIKLRYEVKAKFEIK